MNASVSMSHDEPRDMNIPNIFNSYAGMYVTQSCFHALVAVIIADYAMRAWRIEDPLVKQRFRFATVLLPVFSFPLYQLINPARSSVLFRQEALFDSNRWLNMDLWGVVSLQLFFIILLLITTGIFFFQELIPILRHIGESNSDFFEQDNSADEGRINEALASLPVDKPRVIILGDDDCMLFSSTGSKPAIFISTGLLKDLNAEQIRAALAHEIGHIVRSKRPVLLTVFFMRMVMFYNPVVLVEVRRAVRNEEKICDDFAVSLTHRPDALAQTLKKFYPADGLTASGAVKNLSSAATVSLEEHSHRLQLESRIARLEQNNNQEGGGAWFPFILVLLITAGINYFVV